MEQEGEVEGECETEEACDESQKADERPTVLVKELPGTVAVDRGYSAQVWMCGDEEYIMQEVETEGEEGEIITEIEIIIISVFLNWLSFDSL